MGRKGGRELERPRRRNPETHGNARSPLTGRGLRDGTSGYYPGSAVIAGLARPCAVLEWGERPGVQVARVRYVGPDGQEYLTTVEAARVTTDS